ncbi:MAG: dihydroorotate dehydrogenase electron transfer subunit [Thermodesulfobacteriota bacterium]
MDEGKAMAAGEIVDNRPLAPGHYHMTVRLPASFADPSPGQFVMVREAGRMEPLLSRPFSVFDFHRRGEDALLELLYRTVGRGTGLLSGMKPGGALSVLGPLGRGFTMDPGIRRALFVAGGVGVAPLHFLLRRAFASPGKRDPGDAVFYFGAASRDLPASLAGLSGLCDLRIATDDGSRGFHGTVTGLLEGDIDGYDPGGTALFGCGPAPMIRALALLLADRPIPCQVSLEERMACGMGACLGCAVATGTPEGERAYRKVCEEGPVFDIRQILSLLSCEQGGP